MVGWVYGLMGRWLDGYMGELVGDWTDRLIDVCKDGWMGSWKKGQMSG
jgi:hypothetical protein